MNQQQLKNLLEDMSLEEKIGQLLQLSNSFYEDEAVLTGPAMQLGIGEKQINEAGSVLSVFGAEQIKSIQETAMKKQPHHIPLLFMADIINGYKTIFPIPLAQGCSFQPELVKKCASVSATEAAVSGLHVTFSPMVDLVRDARWGRVMESTGEDTYLNGLMSEAMVEGYQGDRSGEKLDQFGHISACIKHFAAYGAPEAGREYNNVELSERTLREDYLPAYKKGIDAGSAMVMTSFNTLDHIPATGNKWLMQDILRGEMGFEGVLISDWAAIEELVSHGIAEDRKEAARLAMEAGVDMDMVTGCYINHLQELVENGQLKEQQIDEAVMRILELKNQLGLFENPYKDADDNKAAELCLCEEHRRLARKAAADTMVLLKNENDILPIQETAGKIAVIGPYGEEGRLYGAWSLQGTDADTVTIKEGIEEAGYDNDQIVFYAGSSLLDEDEKLYGFKGLVKQYRERSNEDLLQEAVHAAKGADTVVMALGEHAYHSGEGGSRADITIPECQMHLLREIAKVNQNIITIVFAGRPLDLREIADCSKAVLYAWFPGSEGGSAIADLLFGMQSPSAKLSMTMPYSVGQVPVYYGGYTSGRPFNGNRTNRFQAVYQDIPNEPLYPFGYGLTYTSFSYSKPELDQQVMSMEDELHVSVTVTNTGKRTGTETVQLYLRDLKGSTVRPTRRLKGFERITLEPGEEKQVTFKITEDMLRFYDIHMDYVSEPGEFALFIGGDSATQNEIRFELQSQK
ncbi:MAG: beta-glucosidase BglX [bacterium]|nr:beta-glucosidase BglX [bacterium]